MKSRNQGVAQVGMLWGNSFIGQLISLFFVILVVREIGLVEFGRYAICLGIVTLSALLVDLGLSILYTSKVAASEMSAQQAKGELRFYRWISCFLVLLVALVMKIGGLLDTDLLVAASVGAISALDQTWLLQAKSAIREIVISEIITRISTLLFWLGASHYDSSTLTALMSLGFGFAVRCVYTNWLSRVKAPFPSIPSKPIRVLVNASPLMFAKLMNLITNQLTPLFFAASTNVSSLGLFSSAEKPIRALQAAANTYSIFALPRLASMERRHLSKSLWRHAGVVFLICGVISLISIAVSPLASLIIIGSINEEWVACFLVLALVPMVTSVNNLIAASVVPIIGKTQVNLYSSIVGASTLVLLVFLLPKPFNALHLSAIVLAVEATITLSSGVQLLLFFRWRARKQERRDRHA